MDKATRDRLKRTGQTIPTKLIKDAMKKEKVFGEEQEMLEEMRRSAKTNHERKILDQVVNGKKMTEAFEREHYIIDPAKEAKIKQHVDRQIQRDMKSGKLKAPKRDGFIKMMEDNFKRHANKKN